MFRFFSVQVEATKGHTATAGSRRSNEDSKGSYRGESRFTDRDRNQRVKSEDRGRDRVQSSDSYGVDLTTPRDRYEQLRKDVTSSVTKEQTRKIDGKNMRFTFVEEPKLNGMNLKYIMKDQHGDRWLFKPSGRPGDGDWKGEAEVGANKLLKALGYFGVDIGNVTLNIPGHGELSGSIQKMIELKTWGLDQIDISQLTDENRFQLQQHQIMDYAMGNTDCHAGNFGLDKRRKIVAFDKGAAMRDSELVNPNSGYMSGFQQSNLRFYRILWDGWMQDKYTMDLTAVGRLIRKIENLPNADLVDMFRDYAEGREKQEGKSAKELLDSLVKRKNGIRQAVVDFYAQLADQKGISFDGI